MAKIHGVVLGLVALAGQAQAGNILFIGNSFTFAARSPVRFWHADSVTDLNGQGQGGMPALFKAFTTEAGLSYDVFLETEPGVGLDWHLEHRSAVIGQRSWDNVVMHGYSTLDAKKPGDPALLVDTTRRMASLLRVRNPAVEIRLMATWPRADQTYMQNGFWFGKPIDAMAQDVRAGYDLAAAGTPDLKDVVPVGDAWIRAIRSGVADVNPYDGIEANKIDLWSWDHYHASAFGYYLEALVVFGSVTGLDPRSLGDNECAGFELGLSKPQVHELQRVAFDQLSIEGAVKPAPQGNSTPGEPRRCGLPR